MPAAPVEQPEKLRPSDEATEEVAETVTPPTRNGSSDARAERLADEAYEVLMSLGWVAHPDAWKQAAVAAVEQGMELREFKEGMFYLEKSGRVEYHMGDTRAASYYYNPQVLVWETAGFKWFYTPGQD